VPYDVAQQTENLPVPFDSDQLLAAAVTPVVDLARLG
jgi:hypothetical protein